MKKSIYKVYSKVIELDLNCEKKCLKISGPLGNLKYVLNGNDIDFYDNKVFLKSKMSLNSFLSFLKLKILGVLKGYYIELRMVGLGYRFLILKNVLVLRLGYSHYIKIDLLQNVQYIGYKNKLIIFGLDLQEVNEIGYKLKALKIPDRYKGKGIHYCNEIIKLKVGKKK